MVPAGSSMFLHDGRVVEGAPRSVHPGDSSESPSPADGDRTQSGDARDRAAQIRDQTAEDRDKASDLRDSDADVRDLFADHRDLLDATMDAAAAADRAEARGDRVGSAAERGQAADDRHASSSDRASSAEDRTGSSIDQLTGAYRRDAGRAELERELVRANRTGQPFVLAFIDVDGLKQTNDLLGHAAGDQLLRQIVETIKEHLRSYDLIVRFGGDEFVCALPAVDITTATERFELIQAALVARAQASISVGFAAPRVNDTLDSVLARADQALLAKRRQRPGRI